MVSTTGSGSGVTIINIGGLIGVNGGAISNSHAVASVSGTASTSGSNTALDIGGLVGANYAGSSITRSFASGNVHGVIGHSPGFINAGGLVGIASSGTGGFISQSYATGSVLSDAAGDVGGLVGNSGSPITQSFATGAVRGGTGSTNGGLVGFGFANITQSYAAGLVINGGGLVGFFDTSLGGVISSSYSLTTPQLATGLPAGFDSAVWTILPKVSYPQLKSVTPLSLSFPLVGKTPEEASIISVFDHSMESAKDSGILALYSNGLSDTCDGEVRGFTGDVGLVGYGSYGKTLGDSDCKHQPGYKNINGTAFRLIGANYAGATFMGGQAFLNYDGHPGYDYVASYVSLTNTGTPVLSAVPGKIFYPLSMVGNTGFDAYCRFNVTGLVPDAAPNFRVYYLHSFHIRIPSCRSARQEHR